MFFDAFYLSDKIFTWLDENLLDLYLCYLYMIQMSKLFTSFILKCFISDKCLDHGLHMKGCFAAMLFMCDISGCIQLGL